MCTCVCVCDVCVHLPLQVLEHLDYVCTAFFTLELIIRLVFAPNKLNFIRDLMNIVDILALLPLYVQVRGGVGWAG